MLDPTLRAFFESRIRQWLDREVGPHRFEVSSRGARFTLLEQEEPRYQLVFHPARCRWELKVRRGLRWRSHVPDRDALALTDWLGQVRRLATNHP